MITGGISKMSLITIHCQHATLFITVNNTLDTLVHTMKISITLPLVLFIILILIYRSCSSFSLVLVHNLI